MPSLEIVSIFMEGQDPNASPKSPHRQRRRISHPHELPSGPPPYANFTVPPQLMNSNPSGNFSYPPMQHPYNFHTTMMMQPPPVTFHRIDNIPQGNNTQRAHSVDHYNYYRAPIEQDVKPPHSPYLQTSALPMPSSGTPATDSIPTLERIPHPKIERLSNSPTPPETPMTTGKKTIYWVKIFILKGIMTTKQTSTQPPQHSDVSYRIIPTIPQRKGEKMIFYLALIGRDGSVAKEFNDECHINPTSYEGNPRN
jgi:hypothetical protein